MLSFFLKILEFVFPHRSPRRDWRTVTADDLWGTAAQSTKDNVTQSTKAFVPFSYADPLIREALHDFKYNGATTLSRVFATAIADTIREDVAERHVFGEEKILVIPVPATIRRVIERGYNQTELIARDLVSLFREHMEYCEDGVTRVKETMHQTRTVSKKDRYTNMHNAFSVPVAERVRGRDVLLLDDVITTGATILEIANLLTAHGARRVFSCAVAH
ncbi:MAG: phosphoribosyltransferase family protein [Patescibacteria group bacterium]